MHARTENKLPEGVPVKMVTYFGAAALMSISDSEVRRMVKRGELVAVRVNRLVRIPVDEIDAWIERAKLERAVVPGPGNVVRLGARVAALAEARRGPGARRKSEQDGRADIY